MRDIDERLSRIESRVGRMEKHHTRLPLWSSIMMGVASVLIAVVAISLVVSVRGPISERTTFPTTARELFDAYERQNPNLKRLPWPPPTASAQVKLPRNIFGGARTLQQVSEAIESRNIFGGARTLQQVSEAIESELDKARYDGYAFYYVPYGFALVTRLEQIVDDGSPHPEHRWLVTDLSSRMYHFTLSEYLRVLFRAPEGRYRTIIFVVSAERFAPEGPALTKQRAITLTQMGEAALRGNLYSAVAFDESYEVIALIYEFHVLGRETEPALVIPGSISGVDHLTKAALWPQLRTGCSPDKWC